MSFLLLSVFVIPLSIWLALRYRNGYWKRRGVPFIPATVVVGNFNEMVTLNKSLTNQFSDWYHHPAGKDSAAVGIHLFHRPALVVRDLALVKAVLLKDFSTFSNR